MSTRVLLTAAVFAAVQSIMFISVAPFTATIAAFAPPLYALVAAVYSVMIFATRRFTAVTGSATLAALVTGLLVSAFSPLGPVILVPLLVSAALYEGVLLLLPPRPSPPAGRGRGQWRFAAAAVAAGVGLFVVSLPVFSPEHLKPGVLVLTLLARVAGELAASGAAGIVVRLLGRAGVRGLA
jgi:hypothetical protein